MKYALIFLGLIISSVMNPSHAQSTNPVSLIEDVQTEAPDMAALQLDPAAEAIVKLALERSPEIAKVAARLSQAKADAGIAKAALLPSLAFTSGPTRTRNKTEATNTSAQEVSFSTRQESVLSFRWELDLFSANRSLRKAALNELDAATLELQAAQIQLANTIRAEIVSYRAAIKRETFTKELIQTLENTLQMEQALERAGIRSGIDINDLRSEIQSSIASYRQLEIEAQVSPLKLRTLTDVDIPTLTSLTQHETSACVPPHASGIPLSWLQQRLDVRIAQSRLFASMATAKSAQAAIWPSFTISADASKTRLDSGGMLGAISKSTDAFVLAQLAATLFDGGRRRRIRDRSRADVDIAKSEFKTVVLLAAEETESALIAHQVRLSAALQNQAARDAAIAAYSNSQLRRRAGIDSELVLSRSQRQMLERQIDSIAASRDQCIAAIDLNRAIALGESHLYQTPTGAIVK
jgi:outer membrane protein, multidrug efflux system